MIIRLPAAVAIKPSLIRLSVEATEGEDIIAEASIATDYTKYLVEDENGQLSFDFDRFKQDITQEFALLQKANYVANNLKGMEWEVIVQENEEKSDERDTSSQE